MDMAQKKVEEQIRRDRERRGVKAPVWTPASPLQARGLVEEDELERDAARSVLEQKRLEDEEGRP